jgi:hypothetical protein
MRCRKVYSTRQEIIVCLRVVRVEKTITCFQVASIVLVQKHKVEISCQLTQMWCTP